jgi:hypothetical protein
MARWIVVAAGARKPLPLAGGTMHLTEQASRITLAERDRPAEIEITPAMIEAGVTELRHLAYGSELSEVVEAIYLMMELERRVNSSR